MLVCIEIKSDSGSGLCAEVERMRHYIEGYIRGGKVAQLIATEEEYRLLDGLSRALGIEQDDVFDIMAIYGIPVVRAGNEET